MLRKHARSPLAVALVLVLGAGCASAGGEAGNRARFERDVGMGSAEDVVQGVEKVLMQHQFEILQKMDSPQLYWETRWRDRAPYPDEQAEGVSAAQVRAFVRARPRGGSNLGAVYNVNLVLENRVRLLGSTEWTATIATDAYREWAATVVADMKRELEVGVRTFIPPSAP